MRVLQSTRPHSSVELEQSAWLTSGELADGKVTSGSIIDVVLPTPLCTHWYPWLARWITGATTPASMVDRRWRVVADSSSSMMACLGERGYNISRS